MKRLTAAWAFLLGLIAVLVAVNVAFRTDDAVRTDLVTNVVYLAVAAALMSLPVVKLERGRLTLTGIIAVAAAILLNPLDATLVSLLVGIENARAPWPLLGNSLTFALATSAGALVSVAMGGAHPPAFAGRVLVLLTVTLANLVLASVALGLLRRESPAAVFRHNVTASFFIAFGYFALAGLLISYVLDGSVLGYFLATIVCVLALALTDTIAGRRVRRVLESELSDADRHLFHSRAVEGVVHNLRNHMATAVGYLKEIDPRRLDPVDRDAVETATAAANDAVTVLRTLSQGATPRVSYATEAVDLNGLASRALDMARPRARSKEVELGLKESPDEVKVRADPLLLREVITNLLSNAIDAAPQKGRVDLRIGRRGNGSPYLSVADNGPGVADDNRHHLFEPHFTTKESGTGLGLFMSYGVVREHQGQLIYAGSRRGAVFTVTLPPFAG